MIASHVPTLPFVTLSQNPPLQEDIEKAKTIVGYPLIIKPSVSYGSMMISTKSVVDGPEQMISYLTETDALKDYKDEIFLESFLAGREFTVLCSGDERVGVRVYTAAERVFAPNLKEREKILTFEISTLLFMKKFNFCNLYVGWDGCDLNANTTGEVPAQPYWYEAAPTEFQDYLQGTILWLYFANISLIDLAKKAYLSVNGTGYGRVDIRTRSPSSRDGYVLEVNANCGLAFGRMASSLGEILILSKVEPDEFCKEIIDYGSKRFEV
jgi:D-alanine-D-alanine ligase-like ATP-grasp enzyme